jgi:hypothetical protein
MKDHHQPQGITYDTPTGKVTIRHTSLTERSEGRDSQRIPRHLTEPRMTQKEARELFPLTRVPFIY